MAIKIRNTKEAFAALVAHHLSFPVVGIPSTGPDERRSKIATALQEYRGYPGLIKLVSAIDEYDYTKLVGEGISGLGVGQIVVPLENSNSHNYPIGRPALSTGSNSALIRENGTTGNNLDTSPGHWRSATKEEAEAFYAALPKAGRQMVVHEAFAKGLIVLDVEDEAEPEAPAKEPVAVAAEED